MVIWVICGCLHIKFGTTLVHMTPIYTHKLTTTVRQIISYGTIFTGKRRAAIITNKQICILHTHYSHTQCHNKGIAHTWIRCERTNCVWNDIAICIHYDYIHSIWNIRNNDPILLALAWNFGEDVQFSYKDTNLANI